MTSEAGDASDHATPPPGAVVVGVDGSADATRAVTWATHQARLERRPLVLIQGLDTFAWHGLAGWRPEDVDPLEMLRLAHDAARATLVDAARSIQLIDPDLRVLTRVVDLDPRQALVEASRTAHLMVLGSRGHGSVRGLLLGSVSVAVAQLASCPVVVCRPPRAELSRHGVVVGADGAPASTPVLDFAFRQASLHQAPLTVTHCYWDAATAAAPRTVPASSGPEDMQRLLAEAVAGFAETYPDVELHVELSTGLVDQVLAQRASEADLLVVGRPHRSALARIVHGSLAAAVVQHAAGTVAIVPEDLPDDLA